MDSIKEQIRKQMHTAFKDLLTQTFRKAQLEESDILWIESLLTELRDRINGLTPSRQDLHASLNSAFDVKLIIQMLRHGAADCNDLIMIAHTITERLATLCAPVQDESVAALKSIVANAEDMNACLAALLYESNVIIDEIDRLNEDFSTECS